MHEFEFVISVNELSDHLLRPDWRVVDCRFSLLDPGLGREEYRAGHIPTASYADLDQDLAASVTPLSGRHPLPDPDDMAATLGRLGIDNETQVVVYDDASGAIAARLWWLLNWLGHSRVAVLDGGFKAWRQSKQVVRDLPKLPVPTFTAKRNNQLIVETDDLARRLTQGPPMTLVDARDRSRFAGEVEPIDTVAGHIPGAANFPFADSLDSDGFWLRPEMLAEKWSKILGRDNRDGWVAMCGSGVTACHLAISAQRAGFAAPALYVGSWSEWIRDPSRPVATGPA